MVLLPLYNFVNVGDAGPPSLFYKNLMKWSFYLCTTSSMFETPAALLILSKPHEMVLLPLYNFVNVGDARLLP